VVALRDGHRVALFFSGHRHAGENLAQVLRHRAEDSKRPVTLSFYRDARSVRLEPQSSAR
jgi:hypothetical protein